MYIRIQGNSIRFRINLQEANQLLDNKLLSDELALSNDYKLKYQIQLTSQQNVFEFNKHENVLGLKINKTILEQELKGRPSKKGIQFLQNTNGLPQAYTLEIDLKK